MIDTFVHSKIHSEKKSLFYLRYTVPSPKLLQRGPLKPGRPVSGAITSCFLFSVQKPALGSHTITWSCLLVLCNAAGIERKVSKWMMKILIIMSDLICNCIAVSSIFVHFRGVDKIKLRSFKNNHYANLHKVVHVIMLTQERPQSI